MNYIHTIRVGEQEYAIAPAIDDTSADPQKTWSAQKLTRQEQLLLERLCPPISESAKVVRCRPVEGYPLQVTTQLQDPAGSLTLHTCGKNLFDYTAYPLDDYYIYVVNGAHVSSSGYSAIKEYMPIGHLKGLTVTLNHPGAEKSDTTNAGLAFYDADKQFISASNGYSHLVPENAEYLRFSVPREYADGTQVQLELGSRVTEYEPYRKQVLTVQFPEPVTSHRWQEVKAAGDCTFWSSAGTTLVEGRADPAAILKSLTEAVNTLTKGEIPA